MIASRADDDTTTLASRGGSGTASTFRICGIELKRKEDAPSSEFLAIGTIDHDASNEGLTFETHRWEDAVVEIRRCRRSRARAPWYVQATAGVCTRFGRWPTHRFFTNWYHLRSEP